MTVLVTNEVNHVWILPAARPFGVFMQEVSPCLQLQPVEAEHEMQVETSVGKLLCNKGWIHLRKIKINI